MRIFNILILTALSLFTYFAEARTWERSYGPSFFNVEDYYFHGGDSAELDLEYGPWSGYHWPNKVKALHYIPRGQKLSPLEKWEQANYDGRGYDIRTHIDTILGRNQEVKWGGFCHGYSAASLEYREPTKKVVNGVTFYHSDIKALFAIYYDYLMTEGLVKSYFVGKKCNEELPKDLKPEESISDRCDGVNAGSFHLALRQKIKIDKKGFVMDLTRGHEIWNVPVIGYSTKIISRVEGHSRRDARGTESKYQVQTVVSYLTYQKPEEDYERIRGYEGQKIKRVVYNYILELDEDEKIIGGEWLQVKRPDFLWSSSEFPRPEGEWEILNELIFEKPFSIHLE